MFTSVYINATHSYCDYSHRPSSNISWFPDILYRISTRLSRQEPNARFEGAEKRGDRTYTHNYCMYIIHRTNQQRKAQQFDIAQSRGPSEWHRKATGGEV